MANSYVQKETLEANKLNTADSMQDSDKPTYIP